MNLELKPSDSSANPYLALGASILAGLDGIRRKLDPGEAVNVDPATLSDAERLARGAPPSAQTPWARRWTPWRRTPADGLPRRRCAAGPTWR